ncbi:MAG: LacI family DNA-binding transcriptional regulator [Herbinix sp.]|nr:LacI family DNA-binding transcriptional regulator [Herbinix sp.]
MVSMKDIAHELNLSRCTVSNILNNKLEGKSYKKETIELVLKKACEMNYVPNNIARSLKTGSTRTIALVVPDICNSFYTKIIKEVELLAYAENYSLIVCVAEEILEKENKILEMLASRRIDGVLISPVSSYQSLQGKYPFKIVCFDRIVNNRDFCSVLINNEDAAKELTLRMIERGITNPLFLATSKDDYTVQCRLKASIKTLNENNIQFNPANIIYNVYDSNVAYESLKMLQNQPYINFDSVILSTNFCIYGVLSFLKERGLTLKSIGGFENFTGSKLVGKDVIKVLQPEKEIAFHAFRSLMDLVDNDEASSVILNTVIQ